LNHLSCSLSARTGLVAGLDAADELLSLAQTTRTASYSYDPHGNRLSETPAQGAVVDLTFDEENRLTACGTTTYRYDGEGLRASSTSGTAAHAFVWDRRGVPRLLQAGSSYYVYRPGGYPLEEITGATALYFYHDHLGSTQMLTDQTGAVAATYIYNPYGRVLTKTGSVSNPFLFAGANTNG
jgi:YD repeat-containing protein